MSDDLYARLAIPMLAAQGAGPTLFARDTSRIDAPDGTRVIEGDVLDPAALEAALAGQDIVYANLGGEVSRRAEALVTALDKAGVARLIFIVSLGIYHELPAKFEKWNQQMIGDALIDYRRAVDVSEASDLDYILIRPAWPTDAEEIDYEISQRDEQFKAPTYPARASPRSSPKAVTEKLLAEHFGRLPKSTAHC